MWTIRDQTKYASQSIWQHNTAELIRSDREVPHWPKLLHLYSRFKPGKTVLEWMEEHDVVNVGVDVRRFTSFGVVKVRP